ncbi:fungal-specific transcription factor domain-containing protein [Xylogone sp. PMI_703]|nr:fungal-specific transcription factor domain-containing protein [Xylogone sp. PMI_703]
MRSMSTTSPAVLRGGDRQSTMKANRKLYRCHDCHFTFGRPSHLDRHAASHHPRHQRKHLSCPQCDKSFLRSDVLLRHLRGVHQIHPPRKGSSQRSCFHCVHKKLKCNREQPCQSCINAQSSCVYKKDATKINVDSELLDESAETLAYVSEDQIYPVEMAQSSFQCAPESPTPQQDHGTHASNVEIPTPESYIMVDGTNSTTLSETHLPVLDSYENSSTDNTTQCIITGSSLDIGINDLTSCMGFGSGGLDWLDFQLQESVVDSQSSIDSSFMDTISVPSARDWAHQIPDNATGLDSSSALRMESTASGNLPVRGPSQAWSAVQTWPFDQSRELQPSRYQLPPLHDVLQGAITNRYGGNLNTIESLIQLLSNPYIPRLDDSLGDHTIFPAVHLLQRTVEKYFTDFHSILPIIHIPTWTLSSCPTVLLTSMACIGAMTLGDADSMDKSKAFSELCTRMIHWLGGSDNNNYSDLAYLSACCLYQIYSLGSGNRQLYQDADRSRGILVGSLRGMGLLKSRISIEIEKGDFQPSTTEDPDEVKTEWLQWRDQEQEKRVTWASFEYDCSLSTLTGRRGAVDLGELPRSLPCTEALWEASSAQAWRTFTRNSLSFCFGISVAEALQCTTSGKPTPRGLSSWGKRLCSQVIGRLLWDLKQLEVVSLPGTLRLPSLLSVQRQVKISLLQGFDNLSPDVKNPGSNKELIDYNITQLITHYCNLYSAEDLMELVVFIVRNTTMRHTSSEFHHTDAAKRHLKARFSSDPCRTRRLIWHAAQIIAVANQYLVSAPCEILRIFMGCIFLMAFAKYGPGILDLDINNRRQPVKLDEIDELGSKNQVVAEWISSGGPASIAGFDNIYNEEFATHISLRTQSLLQRIQFWGLSHKFIKILEIFQNSGE